MKRESTKRQDFPYFEGELVVPSVQLGRERGSRQAGFELDGLQA